LQRQETHARQENITQIYTYLVVSSFSTYLD